jgi:hypothetical protein
VDRVVDELSEDVGGACGVVDPRPERVDVPGSQALFVNNDDLQELQCVVGLFAGGLPLVPELLERVLVTFVVDEVGIEVVVVACFFGTLGELGEEGDADAGYEGEASPTEPLVHMALMTPGPVRVAMVQEPAVFCRLAWCQVWPSLSASEWRIGQRLNPRSVKRYSLRPGRRLPLPLLPRHPQARAAGIESLRRLDTRLLSSHAVVAADE